MISLRSQLVFDEGRDPSLRFEAIERWGATAIRVLPDWLRVELVKEAKQRTYHREERVVPGSGVTKELESHRTFEEHDIFLQIARDFEDEVDMWFSRAGLWPFVTPFRFNNFVLQHFWDGSCGISPHLDYGKCINLICIIVLSGDAQFYVCDGRDGTTPINPRTIWVVPGQCIIMRSTGYLGNARGVMHGVGTVSGDRYTFTMRQMEEHTCTPSSFTT